MAEEKALTVWRRMEWCAEAEQAIGPLLGAGADRQAADIAARQAHLYYVEGPLYGGWFLLRFEDGPEGLIAHCIAFNGRNAGAGLGDLLRLVRKAGAVELTCWTEQEAVARLYRRQGWDIAEYFLRIKTHES